MENAVTGVRNAMRGLRSGDVQMYDEAMQKLQQFSPVELRNTLVLLEESGEMSRWDVIQALLISNDTGNVRFALRESDSFQKVTRHAVCMTLQVWPQQEAIKLLVNWAEHDTDVDVRVQACWALGSLPGDEAEAVLTRIAATDDARDSSGTPVKFHATEVRKLLRT